MASNIGFLAGWESFSLSDSPPSLSVSAAGAFFSDEASCLAAPNKFEGAVLLGAKIELPLAADASDLPKIEPLVDDGANLSGVVLGFHV